MSKLKKKISDTRKIDQIRRWNISEISRQNINFRPKKVHFDSTTRFLDACINFYKDEINELLKSDLDVNCADKDNLTAIHQACINSRIDLVEYLLQKNANINVCDKEGWTPLHIAADIGSYELAKFLVDHGARLDSANHDGDLPSMLVDEKEYPDLKIYLQKEMDKRNINVDECSNYERAVMLEDVNKWISNGKYDPPIDPIYHSTPVHVAASKNYVDILLKLLPLLTIEDINAQDVDGWTGLHAAAHWGHKEACTLLIFNGADIDIRTRANETVLDTVDPILKDELTAEINKAQKEKMKNHNLEKEIFLRPDAANKRRSSIARQSVEWKKNAQMKESVSERQTLIKAGLNTESSGIITIEETDEKIVSPQEKDKPEMINIDQSKEKNTELETFHIIPDKKLVQSLNAEETGTKNSEKNLLSNGDNFRNNENLDSNNKLLMNNLHDERDLDSEEIQTNQVQMRPRSVRDEIISHRSVTNSRLSLVMAPAKSEEPEVCRREKARRVRSIRRSTQAIDLGGVKEVEFRNNPEITDSIKLENTVKCSLEPIQSVEIVNNINDVNQIKSNKYNDMNINNVNDISKSGRICDTLNLDKIDSSSTEKKHIKHQNSCPTSQQKPTISLARLNIIKTIDALKKKNGNDTKSIISSIPASFVPSSEKTNRGIDVKKCIESKDFSVHTESICRFPMKKTDNQSFSKTIHSESIEEKNNGSFVAKPVSGNPNKTRFEFSDEFKNKHVDIPNIPETGKIFYEHAEVPCSKDDNPISKTILTRMLHDQAVKLELFKENESLKGTIKEYEDKKKGLDLFETSDRKLNNESNIISKLEKEASKLREENQRLKTQNEALLRVITRIQQELESLR